MKNKASRTADFILEKQCLRNQAHHVLTASNLSVAELKEIHQLIRPAAGEQWVESTGDTVANYVWAILISLDAKWYPWKYSK